MVLRLPFVVSASLVSVVLAAGTAAAAPFESLSCHRVVDQDLVVSAADGKTTVSLHSANASTLPLLRQLLPSVSDTLRRAYGCVELDLVFDDSACTFGQGETFSCASDAPQAIELRAKLSCYDSAHDWDRYTIAPSQAAVTTRHTRRSDGVYLVADLDLALDAAAASRFTTSAFALHRWEYDGFPQSPECTLDGAPLYRH